jgi:hypothetical protein
MTRLVSVTPVLPVLDVAAAAARFVRLGFTASPVEPDRPDYAFVRRDEVWRHPTRVDDHPEDGDVAVVLFVEDADILYAEWSVAGVEGDLVAPRTMPWGMREGTYIDPDGLLLRFCSPVSTATP